MSLISSVAGSALNAGVNSIRKILFSHGAGKISISNRNSERSSAVIISDSGVSITNQISSGGVRVDNDGVSIQGVIANTSKGENIRKGEYSENPRGAKIYTYQETILLESIPKELTSAALGNTTGINTGFGMDGAIPIITDIAPGPVPHFHTITMKHVHRVEPAYLYRVPSILGVLTGASDKLKGFFSA